MTPTEFIDKWCQVELKERAAAQEHFLDLCRLLELPTPAEADPKGDTFTFEKRVSKAAGGRGFADVWKRGHFAWEYKGRGKNLDAAYVQLLLYRDDLENPPLLVVSDIQRILVHTNFTDTTKKVYEIALEDLGKPEMQQLLKQVFTEPNVLNPKSQREAITAQATGKIGAIALRLRDRGHESEKVAHFLMQLVFALFAEDSGLLPNRIVTKILQRTTDNPERAEQYLTMLFQVMAEGGEVLLEDVPFFNGGLFQAPRALPMEGEEIAILHEAAKLDWSEVEPAIFGTLFERSLDPEKRSQLGAHYTSRDDILRIVQPVIMEPLQREWDAIRTRAKEHLEAPKHDHAATASRLRRERVDEPITEFLRKLQTLRVLDPACGSGNFLYIAMQQLKDLERDVVTFAQGVGAPGYMTVGPKQFYGLEINVFARELASMVIWIGYLQWNRANGVSNQQRPILEKLDNIRLHDALMNEDGTEYTWPEAEFIVGNPPFLGDKRMRSELGDEYVETLRSLFEARIPGQSDFVCYWFEKARAMIENNPSVRAGLIATNSIRGGANRDVLRRIKDTGDIFMAWSDEPWILEGAAVRVSIVGFDGGVQDEKLLNGARVADIESDLTTQLDLSAAQPLEENQGRAFIGIQKGGAFDIPGDLARAWLSLPNPSGVSNEAVLRPYANGMDINRTWRDVWIVDFGEMPIDVAEKYTLPFAYVEEKVKPKRERGRDQASKEKWWLHQRSRPDMRAALQGKKRYVATTRHSQHRMFVWLPIDVLPDSALVAVAADDDYAFGILQSSVHVMWALRQGSSLEDRPRYTPTTCFETFPYPRPSDAQRAKIAQWAANVVDIREQLMASDNALTLTKLYSALDELQAARNIAHRMYPLCVAHERLDTAVVTAYGWEWPLEGDEILERLLALNLERTA